MVPAAPGDAPKPPAVDARVSEIMLRELDVKTTSIVRKVAMKPTVLYGHARVVNHGHFDGDIGDWINWCCRFALEKGFGVVPAMMTGHPSILGLMNQRDAYYGRETY